MTIRWLGLLVFLGMLTFFPAQAVAQDADSSGTIKKVIGVVNEVKLGLQVRGGIRGAQQEALPLKNRAAEYLKRPVSGDLSYTVPYYGVGLALRFRGAEVGVAIQSGSSTTSPTRWLQFRDGTDAIPFRPEYLRVTIRAEYFVFDWIGVGAMFQGSGTRISSGCRDCSFQINGTTVDQTGAIGTEQLFGAHSTPDTYSLYVPVREEWRGLQFFGRIGASISGGARIDTYRLNFTRHQNPEQPKEKTDSPPPILGVESFETPKPDANRQFGRVGVGVPLGDLATVQALFRAERVSVSGLTKTWSYEVGLEVGFPF